MKVLFINKFLSRETIYRDHLGIMSLSAAVHPRHDVFIAEPRWENVYKKIRAIKPDVIAYSIRTGYQNDYIALNKELKKTFKFLSVFGGPHATFFPDMIYKEGVDCVCRGEADEAFRELLDALDNKGDIAHIKNFWIRRNEQVFKNPLRPLVQDLDILPFPDRKLFNNYNDFKMSKVKSFITGRGCPFNCSYCFNEGMKRLYNGQTYIKYVCVGLKPDLVDEEIASLLKEGHCIWAIFGVESGNERIRKEILNRNISDKQIINCADLLRKHNVKFSTENILGIPHSSLEDDLKTLRLNIMCKPEFCHAQLMQPYPGTKIYDNAINLGLFNKNNFDILTDFNERSYLLIKDKYERESLQKLFALSVRFPAFCRTVRVLIRLRLRFLYSILYNINKIIAGFKWLPYTRSMREYVSLCRRYFFYK